MNSATERRAIPGPAGALDVAIDAPAAGLRGVAVL